MNAIPTQKPTFTPNRNRKPQQGRQQARTGPSYKDLEKKLAALQKSTDALQSTQEIKYLKKQIEAKNKTINDFALNISGLIGGLKKLGVPEAAIKKLNDNQPVTSEDLGENGSFAVLELADLIDSEPSEAAEQ